jgi:ATPase subunit of ABC transporter with duplicated ATPase domains
MRLCGLRLWGITKAFPNEVSVDFDALAEEMITLVGENGAGKSILIGSIFASIGAITEVVPTASTLSSIPFMQGYWRLEQLRKGDELVGSDSKLADGQGKTWNEWCSTPDLGKV